MDFSEEEILICKKFLLEIVGKEKIIDMDKAIQNVLDIVYAKGGWGKEEHIKSYIKTLYATKDSRVFGIS